MGIVRRIALVLRSYLSATSERLDRAAEEEARREIESRKQALEELKSLEAQPAATRTAIGTAAPSISPEVQRLAADFRLLGLSPNADLKAVEAAWRTLASRADPKRFPAGSDDEKRAAEILGSVNEAYARIREALNPTEGRFGQLEL